MKVTGILYALGFLATISAIRLKDTPLFKDAQARSDFQKAATQ